MSSKKKAAEDRGRYIALHRKDPSWSAGDRAGMPGGRGAKIVIVGVAGAALAIPAASAFASPSSIPMGSAPAMVRISKAAGHGGAYHIHAAAAARPKTQPDGQVPPAFRATQQHQAAQHQAAQHQAAQHQAADQRGPAEQRGPSRHMPQSPTQSNVRLAGSGTTSGSANAGMPPAPQTGAASDAAGPPAQGPGLLLEPDGTFATLAPSATNVLTVPAGSLIIASDGTLVSPPVGTYVTSYGLMTVAQAPGSGTTSASTATPGAVSVNPGGPLQAPPQQPSATAAPATTAPTPTMPIPTTQAPPAAPTPAASTPTAPPTTAAPPAAVTAKPPVQVVSALAGATVADNGTVTPNASANLAFPGSGIGGSLPLSLPSAAPASAPAQPTFPPADQNAVLSDPVLQGLTDSLGPQASPNPLPSGIQAASAPAGAQLIQLAQADNGVINDAGPGFAQATGSAVQPAQNLLIPDPNTPLLPGGVAPNLIPPSGGIVPGGTTFTDPGGVTYNIPYDSSKPITVTIPDSTVTGPGETFTVSPGGSINLGTANAYIPGNRDQVQLPDGTYFVGPAPAPGQPDTRTQVIIQTSPPPGLQGQDTQPPAQVPAQDPAQDPAQVPAQDPNSPPTAPAINDPNVGGLTSTGLGTTSDPLAPVGVTTDPANGLVTNPPASVPLPGGVVATDPASTANTNGGALPVDTSQPAVTPIANPGVTIGNSTFTSTDLGTATDPLGGGSFGGSGGSGGGS